MPRKLTVGLASAANLLKALLRKLLPQVVKRIIRTVVPQTRPSPRRLGIVEYREHSVRLSSGRTLWHRGSEADICVIRQILEQRDYDLRRLARFNQIQALYDACPQPIIIDCGANIGASCVWFADSYPRSKLLAIEPDNVNFGLLQKNCAGLNVIGINGAIASKPGMLSLVDPGIGEWGYRTSGQDAEAVAKVRAYSIDELMHEEEGTPFILKIDIEGAEEELFDAPSRELDRFPIVIIELHDWMLPAKGTSKPFLKWHVGGNRDFVHFGENIFSIANDFPSIATHTPGAVASERTPSQ